MLSVLVPHVFIFIFIFIFEGREKVLRCLCKSIIIRTLVQNVKTHKFDTVINCIFFFLLKLILFMTPMVVVKDIFSNKLAVITPVYRVFTAKEGVLLFILRHVIIVIVVNFIILDRCIVCFVCNLFSKGTDILILHLGMPSLKY